MTITIRVIIKVKHIHTDDDHDNHRILITGPLDLSD
jgi:hypothetical protein